MSELRKEERLFLEIGKRRGSIQDAALAQARERAKRDGVSIVEVLVSQNLVKVEDADAIRKDLFALSFTCPSCEGIDFRELDEPKLKTRRCADCIAKVAPPPPKARPASAKLPADSGATTFQNAKTDVATISETAPPSGQHFAPNDEATIADPPTHAISRAPTGQRPTTPADPEKTEAGGAGTEAGPLAQRAPLEEITPGVVLGGCRIEKRIGQGGMGRVYRGHHDGLDRDMAVKVIDDRLAANKNFVEQFFVEARTLAKLDHANIVRIFNVDTDANGRAFIVMELLQGGSVEDLWRETEKRLPVDVALRVTKEAAEGLLHAHKAGLIHRDVKPGNLMLTERGPEGRVKVVDFGLAARTENDVFIATDVAGTPQFMAPEQVDGLRLDPRCDQYALGASLFSLLCGRPVFTGKRPVDVMLQHVKTPAPHARELREDVPEWLDAVIAKTLAKAPKDRFPSLAELVKALEQKSEKPQEAPAPARPAINSSEIVKLEKGLKAKPVAPPAWRPAALAMAACLIAAVLFLAIPARSAFGGADLGLGDVPGYVHKLEKEARARAASGRAEDLDAAIHSLAQSIDDMKALAGAATLKHVQGELDEQRKMLAKTTEDAVSKRVTALVAASRWGALLDLADPSSSTLITLGLGEKTNAWRAPANKALEERGEVWIPAGSFASGEAGLATAVPGFYIDVTEVTNEAWEAAREKAGLARPASWPAGPLPAALAKKPVTAVTFEDAQRFAKAIGKRLPTSLEWEKAARGAKDARAWPWGPRFEPGRANLLDGGSGALEDVAARPKDESPYGVRGMAGNAMEWVTSPEGPLVAGGAFRSHALSARVFARFRLEGKDPAVGFRCARDAE